MNGPIVIASAILAVAITAAAWLLKPIPQPCWTTAVLPPVQAGQEGTAYVTDRCAGKVWLVSRMIDGLMGSLQVFPALSAGK